MSYFVLSLLLLFSGTNAEEIFVYSYSGRVWAYLKSISGLVSIIFLILTIFTYTLSPDRRTVHGKSSIAHILCLLLSYAFHVLLQIIKESITKDVCVIIDVTWMYFGLASFFWLHVMSFDVWRSFRRNIYVMHCQNHVKIFSYYCLYAATTPTIFLAVAIYFDFSNLVPDEASPFCIRKYWTVQFFLCPTFLILLSNLGFFISTSVRIRKIDLEGQEILQNEDFRIHNKLEKQRFKIYLKLFAVTGGSWCLTITGAIILFILDQTTNTDKSLSDHILYGIGTLVGLQSIGIFISCVWATDLRNLLLQRLFPAKFSQQLRRCATESNVNNFTLDRSDGNI